MDRMPTHIAPMKAVLSNLPEDEDLYAYEYKWDGYRAMCYWDGRRLRLESRNQIDFTSRYPKILALGEALGARKIILDGELTAFDAKGRPSFNLLQNWYGFERASSFPADASMIFMIFDVLYLQ